MRIFRSIECGLVLAGYWVMAVLLRMFAIMLGGAILGALVSPIMRLLFFEEHSFLDVALSGAWVGFRYSGIWCFGIALAWTFMDRKGAGRFLKVFNREDRA